MTPLKLAIGRLLVAVLIAIALVLLPRAALPREMWTPLMDAFPGCAERCVVQNSDGGRLSDFYAAAEHVRAQQIPVRILGECKSSCVLFADRARPQVCVERTARMMIHAGRNANAKGEISFFLEMPFSGDLAAWIAARGGQPEAKWLTLQGDSLRSFWPICD